MSSSVLCSRLYFFHQNELRLHYQASRCSIDLPLRAFPFGGFSLFHRSPPFTITNPLAESIFPTQLFPSISPTLLPTKIKSHTLNVSRSKSEYFERKMCVLVFFTSSLCNTLPLSFSDYLFSPFFLLFLPSLVTAPWELLFYYIFSPVLFYLFLLSREPLAFLTFTRCQNTVLDPSVAVSFFSIYLSMLSLLE